VTEPVDASVPVDTRLKDLRPTDALVQILGRVVTVERREYTNRVDGRRRPFLSGLLSDGTATVRFSWWEPPAEGIERGVVLRAVNVQVREFRGRPELSFGFRTRVAPASPLELPPVDGDDIPLRKIRDLGGSDEGFRVEGRIVRLSTRSVTVGTEQRLIHEGLLADRTGSIAFTSWSDFDLKVGEAVRLAGAYVRIFRNRPQLNLDERSTAARIDGTELPQPEEVLTTAPRSIAEIEEAGGGESIALQGVVVGLLPPSGLVYRCPTCRRAVTGGICSTHGAVEGVADLRGRFVIDDGTSSATVNAAREDTEKLWGVTLEEALSRLRDAPDPTLLEEHLFEATLGTRLTIRGRASRDDFGLTVYPESIERTSIDLPTWARGLAARLGS
jgi:replication factor A1